MLQISEILPSLRTLTYDSEAERTLDTPTQRSCQFIKVYKPPVVNVVVVRPFEEEEEERGVITVSSAT